MLKRYLIAAVLLLCASPAWAAAPSLIQCKEVVSDCNTSCSGSFDSTPTVGHHVVAIVPGLNVSHFGVNAKLSSATDNQSAANTYVVDQAYEDSSTYDNAVGVASSKIATASGTFTTTITVAGELITVWNLCEVANLDPTTWFDREAHGNTHGGTSLTVTEAGANTTSNAIVFALIATQPGTTLNDPATGYTRLFLYTAGVPGVAAAYKILTAGETSSAAWSGFASGDAVGGVVVYRGIDAAATLPPQGASTGAGK